MGRFLFVIIVIVSLLWGNVSFSAKDYISDPSIPDNEDGAYPVTTKYKIDVDGDKKPELVKVNYGIGVSDKFLTIEIYKGKKLISKLKGSFGIQSNYKIADIDGDGKKEIIIWSGLWDFRLPGEDGVTEKNYEGHSGAHRYIVATYKFIRGEYYLWDIYTTKKKYEPFCEEMPK
ncbi:MAG: hypothetical protein HQL24_09925 [Candidatus Omnitrophica bacterium]|nr:hypothetical protein [Candidatus Omnitrophota bacterium]